MYHTYIPQPIICPPALINNITPTSNAIRHVCISFNYTLVSPGVSHHVIHMHVSYMYIIQKTFILITY